MAITRYDYLFLKEVHVQGFRSLYDVHVDFKKGLNILIGKNGVGKSNLLTIVDKAIKPAGLNAQEAVKELVVDFEGAETQSTFQVRYTRKTVDKQDLELNPTQRYFLDREYRIDGKEPNLEDSRLKRKYSTRTFQSLNSIIRYHKLWLHRSIFIEFNVPPALDYFDHSGQIELDLDMEEVRYADTTSFLNDFFFDMELRVFDDFEAVAGKERLALMIDTLHIHYIKEHLIFDEDVIETLAKYTPIKDIRFNPNINLYQDGSQLIIDNIKIDFFVNDTWYPWSQLSDGTQRLFHIISNICSPSSNIILLEEPELGIHPHQFDLLMEFLREQSYDKQIILSTHAPQALNHIDLDELDRILIVSYEKQSGTAVRRMNMEEIEKAHAYVNEVGYLSDYWIHSDLEND